MRQSWDVEGETWGKGCCESFWHTINYVSNLGVRLCQSCMFVKVESAGMSVCVCQRGFQRELGEAEVIPCGWVTFHPLTGKEKRTWKMCTECEVKLRMHLTFSHLKMKEQFFPRERLVLPGNGLHHLSWMLCWDRVHLHLSVPSGCKNVILPLLQAEQPWFSQPQSLKGFFILFYNTITMIIVFNILLHP